MPFLVEEGAGELGDSFHSQEIGNFFAIVVAEVSGGNFMTRGLGELEGEPEGVGGHSCLYQDAMRVCGVGNEKFAERVPKYRLEAENEVPCEKRSLVFWFVIDVVGHPAYARFFTHVGVVRQLNVVAFFRVESNLENVVVDEVGKIECVSEMLLKIFLSGVQNKRNRFPVHIQFHLVDATGTGI